MKLFLLTSIVAPAIDFFANNGRYIDVAFGYLAWAAHGILNIGETLMPSLR